MITYLPSIPDLHAQVGVEVWGGHFEIFGSRT